MDKIKLECGNYLTPKESPIEFKVHKKGNLFCTEFTELIFTLGGYSKLDLKESIEAYIELIWEDFINASYDNLQFYEPTLKNYLLDTYMEISQ